MEPKKEEEKQKRWRSCRTRKRNRRGEIERKEPEEEKW